MKLYVYSTEDNSHVATIIGSNNAECEAAFLQEFDINDFESTYSPAFGSYGGLVENPDAEEIEA